jgi:UPF0176 protein
MKYLNLSGYKFISLAAETLPLLREQLIQSAREHHIKGSILLSPEGINVFIAAEEAAIGAFIAHMQALPGLADLWFKKSESDSLPFKRMRVRIKDEIITMKQPDIHPEQHTAPYIEPDELKRWYEENKEMVMLDTRNNYEFNIGSFDGATHLDIENFSDFPQAVAKLPESWKTKPIVTFCTGGIRCEKAAAYLLNQGFTQVQQLKGGIIHYFEQCGGKYYNGNCFVFDSRLAVDPNLNEVTAPVL